MLCERGGGSPTNSHQLCLEGEPQQRQTEPCCHACCAPLPCGQAMLAAPSPEHVAHCTIRLEPLMSERARGVRLDGHDARATAKVACSIPLSLSPTPVICSSAPTRQSSRVTARTCASAASGQVTHARGGRARHAEGLRCCSTGCSAMVKRLPCSLVASRINSGSRQTRAACTSEHAVPRHALHRLGSQARTRPCPATPRRKPQRRPHANVLGTDPRRPAPGRCDLPATSGTAARVDHPSALRAQPPSLHPPRQTLLLPPPDYFLVRNHPATPKPAQHPRRTVFFCPVGLGPPLAPGWPVGLLDDCPEGMYGS